MLTTSVWHVNTFGMHQIDSLPLAPVTPVAEELTSAPNVTKCPPFTEEMASPSYRLQTFQFGSATERKHARANLDIYEHSYASR